MSDENNTRISVTANGETSNVDLQGIERVLLNNNGNDIVPYTVASAVEMKSGLTVEEKIKKMEEDFQGVLDNAEDASATHNHDSIYYRKGEIDQVKADLENRIASINTSDHVHNQYALKDEVYTKTEFNSKFGDLSDIVVSSDLENYVTNSTLNNYATKTDLSNYASKNELDGKADAYHNHDNRYYGRDFINDAINAINSDINDLNSNFAIQLDTKADKDHIHDIYALKETTYTKDEIDGKTTAIENNISGLDARITKNSEDIAKIDKEIESVVSTDDLSALENKIDLKLNEKADKNHTHTTNDIKFTNAEWTDGLLTDVIEDLYDNIDDVQSNVEQNYSKKDHIHDDRYYTETEIDGKFLENNLSIASTYATKTQLNDGLLLKSDITHTHDDLDTRISENQTSIRNHISNQVDDIHPQYPLKSTVYNRDEVDGLITNINSDLTKYVTKEQLKNDLEQKSDIDHNHDGVYLKTLPQHNHDDLYYTKDEIDSTIGDVNTGLGNVYTKTEINGLLNTKSDVDHDHNMDYAAIKHDHDDMYYRKVELFTREEVMSLIPDSTEIATKEELEGKADVDHRHVDLELQIANHTHDDLYYPKDLTMSKEEIELYVSDAIESGAIDMSGYATKKELESKADINHVHTAMEESISELDTYVKNHNHNLLYYTKEDSYSKEEVDALLYDAPNNNKIDLSNYATKAQLDNKADYNHNHPNLESAIDDLDDFVNNHSHANFYTKDSVYTKTEVDNLISNIDPTQNVDLSDYATKVELDTKVNQTEFDSTIASINSNIANHKHDSLYYTKDETYSKLETDDAIENAIKSGKLDMSAYTTKIYVDTELGKKADYDHTHTDLAPLVHNHNNLYYTKEQAVSKDDLTTELEPINTNLTTINNKLANTYTKEYIDSVLSTKSDEGHNHDSEYAVKNHKHNDLYYTKTDVDNMIANINADGEVTIDLTNYVNKTELAEKLLTKADSEHYHDGVYAEYNHNHDDRYYTKTQSDTNITDAIANIGLENYITSDSLTNRLKNYSLSDHTHSDLVTQTDFDAHNHNTLYYTKDETYSKSQVEAYVDDTIRNSDIATDSDIQSAISNHNHDLRYVKIEDASNHTHDQYITSTGVDNKINTVKTLIEANYTAADELLQSAIDNHNHDDKYVKLEDANNHTHEEYVTTDTLNNAIENVTVDLTDYSTTEEMQEYVASQTAKKADKDHTHNDLLLKIMTNEGNIDTISNAVSSIANDLATHDHDTKYASKDNTYTKGEIDSLVSDINNKADISYVDSQLSNKADIDHKHEEYLTELPEHEHSEYSLKNNTYTKPEVDKKILAAQIAASEGVDVSNFVTSTELNQLETKLNKSYSPIKHDHREIGELEDKVNTLTTKVNSHDHNTLYYTKTQVDTLIDNVTFDASDLATKAELNNKADSNHTHSSYESDISSLQTSLSTHNHDSRYYTQSEINTKLDALESSIDANAVDLTPYAKTTEVDNKLKLKADKEHTHEEFTNNTFAPYTHNHDTQYYTEGEIDSKLSIIDAELDDKVSSTDLETKLAGKANIKHTHAEFTDINNRLLSDEERITNHNHDDKYYTEYEIDTKVNELRSEISSKADSSVLSNYSTTDHTHTEFNSINTSIESLETSIATNNDAILKLKTDFEAHNHDTVYVKQETYAEDKTDLEASISGIESDITNIETTLDTKVSSEDLDTKLEDYSTIGHTHTEFDNFALKGHTHDYATAESVAEAIATATSDFITTSAVEKGYATKTELESGLATKADASELSKYSTTDHNHDKEYVKLETLEGIDFTTFETKVDVNKKLEEYSKTDHTHGEFETITADIDALKIHNHDNKYASKSDTYTKTEVESLILSNNTEINLSQYAKKTELENGLATKADINHTHDYSDIFAPINHNHDDRYYTESEIDNKLTLINGEISNKVSSEELTTNLAGKANVVHNHEEFTTLSNNILDISEKLETHNHDNRYYTESEIDNKLTLINGEISNKVSSEELTTNLAGKANVKHDHEEFTTLNDSISSVSTLLSNHNHDGIYAKVNDVYNKSTVDSVTGGILESISNIESNMLSLATKNELTIGLSSKADEDHTHDGVYAPIIHSHDDKYYLKDETYSKDQVKQEITDAINNAQIDSSQVDIDLSIYAQKADVEEKLQDKSDTNHNHDLVYSKLDHNHDKEYVKLSDYNLIDFTAFETKAGVNKKLEEYSKTDHTHEEFTNDSFAPYEHNHDNKYASKDNTYTKEEVDNKVSSDISSAVTELNISQYATKTELNGKADINHTHDYSDVFAPYTHNHNNDYYTKNETYTREQTNTRINEEIGSTVSSLNLTQYATKKALENYALKEHNHSGVYSEVDHTHSQYLTANDIIAKSTLEQNLADINANINELQIESLTHAKKADIDKKLDSKSDINHDHDGVYSFYNHNHDSDYADKADTYTKQEVDNKLSNSITDLNIGQYATKSELENRLNKKSDTDHNHDDVYSPIGHDHDSTYADKANTYTKQEVDNIKDTLETSITAVDTNLSNNYLTATEVSANYATKDHNHDDKYAPSTHNHDTRYYTKEESFTKGEVNTIVSDAIKELNIDNYYTKLQTNNEISKAILEHNHDEKYSDIDHLHDTRYYKKTEVYNMSQIDTTVANLTNSIEANTSKFNEYTNATKLNELLAAKSDLSYVNEELSKKSDTDHTHDTRYYLKDDTYSKEQVNSEIESYVNDSITNLNIDQYATKKALENYALKNHNHSGVYSEVDHTHSQYLTANDIIAKNELQATLDEHSSKLDELAAADTTFVTKTSLANTLTKYSQTSHNHDDVYSKIDHAHDERYYIKDLVYTKLETNSNIENAVNTAIEGLNIGTYAKTAWVTSQLETKSNIGHNHDDLYSQLGHNHNDLYYTKAETYTQKQVDDTTNALTLSIESLDTKLTSNYLTELDIKTFLIDNYSNIDHNHDDVYSPVGHNHDKSYYLKSQVFTKEEVNNLVLELKEEINIGGYYNKLQIDSLLSNKSNIDHDHDTLYSKVDHLHDTRYYKKEEVYNKIEINSKVTELSNDIAINANKFANYTTTKDLVEALSKKSDTTHDHDGVYSPANHKHDDRYYQQSQTYTRTEISDLIDSRIANADLSQYATISWTTTQLNLKSDKGHKHDDDYSPLGHDHDGRYPQFKDVWSKTDLDNKFALVDEAITANADNFANYTTTSSLNKLLAGKSDISHTHDDLYSKIEHAHDGRYYKKGETYTKTEVDDNIAALDITSYAKTTWVTNELAKKSDKNHTHTEFETFAPRVHSHSDLYYGKNETYNKTEVNSLINDSNENLSLAVATINEKLAKKSDITHNHDKDYASIDHLHDGRYYKQSETYNKTEIDTKVKAINDNFENYVLTTTLDSTLTNYSKTNHTHDDRYYVKENTYSAEEIETKISALNSAIGNLNNNLSKNYVTLTAFNEAIIDLNGRVDIANSKISSITSDLNTFKTNVANTYATKDELTTNVNSLSGAINTVRTELNNLSKNVKDNYVTLIDYTAFSNSISSRMSIAETDIKKLQSDFSQWTLAADERYVLNDDTYKAFYRNTNTNIANLQKDLTALKTSYDDFSTTASADISALKGKTSTLETNLSKLDSNFKTFSESTVPNTYVTISTFNSYKSANDTRVGNVERLLASHINEYDAFVTSTENSIATLRSDLTTTNNKLNKFINETAPATYVTISDFDNYKSSVSSSLSSISKNLSDHINSANDSFDAINAEIITIKTNLNTFNNSLSKRITDLDKDLQDYKETVNSTYCTKQELANYKTTVASSISRLDEKIDSLTADVIKTYATKSELNKVNTDLTKSIDTLKTSFDDHVDYAERTYASKSDVKRELDLKADLKYVNDQLATKSDADHNHDTKYLPIKNANMEGSPTAPTPSEGDNSTRIANTEWVLVELEKIRSALDNKKLDKNANAVSASKLLNARTISLGGSASGSTSFNGESDVMINVTLTGNAPTASKWLDTRTITIDGPVTGSADIDGTKDITLSLQYNNSYSAPSADKLSHPFRLTLTGGVDGTVTIDGSQDLTMDTTLTGNAPSATKLNTARKINGVLFDGTKDITIVDGTKLNLSGGLMNGSIVMSNGVPIQYKDKSNNTKDILNLTNTNKLILGYAGLVNGDAMVYSGNNAYAIRHAGDNNYSINGNAATATKLAVARKISIAGGVQAAGVDFDGSDNIILNVSKVDLTSSTLSGILPVAKGGTGNNIGNAPSADKLFTARKINETSFDGTTNITIGTLQPIKIPASSVITNGANDLNNYKTPGMFYADNNTTVNSLSNCPTRKPFALLVEKHSGIHQRITEHDTGNHKVYERNFSGGSWGIWYEVYTTANEPSKTADRVKSSLTIKQIDSTTGNAVETTVFDGSSAKTINISHSTLKVLSLNGGTLNDALTMSNGDAKGIRLKNSGGTNVNGLSMSSSNIVNVGDGNTKTNINSNANPTVTINGTGYTIYHTGNKPTASDVGALATTGGTMTGNITMSNNSHIIMQQSSNKVNLNNVSGIVNGASVLNNSDANIRIATPFTFAITPTTTGGTVQSGNNAVWIDAKTGNIYAAGNIYENATSNTTGTSLREKYMGIVNANGFYGMSVNGNTDNWVRTTNSGLIPYQSGGASSLGTNSWNFNTAYVKNYYENNQKLSDRYLALNENTKFENTKTVNLSGTTLNLTLDRMQKCTSTFSAGRAYTIKLPSVSSLNGVNGAMDTFTIHVLFTSMSGGTLSFTNASGLKWYATPQIITGKTHEFIFTYYNGTWVGGVIHYG